jgi:hypothetical protein
VVVTGVALAGFVVVVLLGRPAGATGVVVDGLPAGVVAMVDVVPSEAGSEGAEVVVVEASAGGPATSPRAVMSPAFFSSGDDDNGIASHTAADATARSTGPTRLPVGLLAAQRVSGTGQAKRERAIRAHRGRARKRVQRLVMTGGPTRP